MNLPKGFLGIRTNLESSQENVSDEEPFYKIADMVDLDYDII